MKKIIVTGSKGQLGSELNDLAIKYPEYEFVFCDKDTLDIADENAVNIFFSKHKPEFVINCAAYTAVDLAEKEREQAMLINAFAVGVLAKAAASINCKLIHISTDYVFDGNANEPYGTSAPTNPVNYYGLTKLEGEKQAINNNPNSIIIRTSWVYSAYGKNFVKTMLRLMNEREGLGVVADQYGSPTYAADLAQAIMHIIVSNNYNPGIYHYANSGIINWHQFAEAIKDISGSNCTVNAITTADYPTLAARPKYSAFDTSKIVEVYKLTIPQWRQSLEICLAKISAKQ